MILSIALTLAVTAARPAVVVRPIDPSIIRAHDRIALNLAPTAKLKLQQVAKSLVSSPSVANPGDEARRAIKVAFSGQQMTDRQLNVLTAFALAEEVNSIKSDLDSKSEMGETESLRLQMAMDRMSKLMTTLSNLLKKINDTDQGLVKNIK